MKFKVFLLSTCVMGSVFLAGDAAAMEFTYGGNGPKTGRQVVEGLIGNGELDSYVMNDNLSAERHNYSAYYTKIINTAAKEFISKNDVAPENKVNFYAKYTYAIAKALYNDRQGQGMYRDMFTRVQEKINEAKEKIKAKDTSKHWGLIILQLSTLQKNINAIKRVVDGIHQSGRTKRLTTYTEFREKVKQRFELDDFPGGKTESQLEKELVDARKVFASVQQQQQSNGSQVDRETKKILESKLKQALDKIETLERELATVRSRHPDQSVGTGRFRNAAGQVVDKLKITRLEEDNKKLRRQSGQVLSEFDVILQDILTKHKERDYASIEKEIRDTVERDKKERVLKKFDEHKERIENGVKYNFIEELQKTNGGKYNNNINKIKVDHQLIFDNARSYYDITVSKYQLNEYYSSLKDVSSLLVRQYDGENNRWATPQAEEFFMVVGECLEMFSNSNDPVVMDVMVDIARNEARRVRAELLATTRSDYERILGQLRQLPQSNPITYLLALDTDWFYEVSSINGKPRSGLKWVFFDEKVKPLLMYTDKNTLKAILYHIMKDYDLRTEKDINREALAKAYESDINRILKKNDPSKIPQQITGPEPEAPTPVTKMKFVVNTSLHANQRDADLLKQKRAYENTVIKLYNREMEKRAVYPKYIKAMRDLYTQLYRDIKKQNNPEYIDNISAAYEIFLRDVSRKNEEEVANELRALSSDALKSDIDGDADFRKREMEQMTGSGRLNGSSSPATEVLDRSDNMPNGGGIVSSSSSSTAGKKVVAPVGLASMIGNGAKKPSGNGDDSSVAVYPTDGKLAAVRVERERLTDLGLSGEELERQLDHFKDNYGK